MREKGETWKILGGFIIGTEWFIRGEGMPVIHELLLWGHNVDSGLGIKRNSSCQGR